MKKIFVSYSDKDRDKMKIIAEIIDNKENLQSIIIATRKEPLVPLTEKVINGIKESDIIIPILTSKSINTQWINQEIGFSIALNKKIQPIVEHDMIDNLKGFIHKQLDLPFTFDNKNEESFKLCVFDIIEKLSKEEKGVLKDKVDEIPIIEGLKQQLGFKLKQKQYISTPEAYKDAVSEASKVIELTDKNAIDNEDSENQIFFSKTKQAGRKIILASDGINLGITWDINYTNSLDKAKLSIWLSKDKEEKLFSGQEVEESLIKLTDYKFTVNNKFEKGWSNIKNEKGFFNSTELVQYWFSFFHENVIQEKLSK